MKVLILTNTIRPDSGWGRYSSDLITGVKKAGHEVTILTEDSGMLKRGLGLFYSALRIRKYMKATDLVHVLDINPYAITAWIANIFIGKPLVITGVGSYSIAPFGHWETRWLVRAACRSAQAIIAISRFVARKLVISIGREDVQVINPGIDVSKFQRDHRAAPEPYILSVGALKQRKGYHIAIAAFAAAKMKIPALKYVIIGNQRDQKYYEKLKKLTTSLGVQDSVRFLANISDQELAALYQGAHVFILTSVNEDEHFEGYGLVFLEAAAAGVPVVGTAGNGIEDAVGKNNGILVPQNDIEQTARALIHILSDSDAWQKMSQAGYMWAQEHALEGAAAKYVIVYDQVMKGNTHS